MTLLRSTGLSKQSLEWVGNIRNLVRFSTAVSLCIDVRANWKPPLMMFCILGLLVCLGVAVLMGTESGK